MKHLNNFLTFESKKKKILYKSEHEERKDLLKTAIKKAEDWTGKPELMYKSVEQGEKLEDKAFSKARELGKIRVYRVVNINDIKRSIKTKGELSVSTELGDKLALGINDNVLVLSGEGEVMTYYNKDVSTNLISKKSDRKLPITPLNKKSEYDEAIAIGKDVNWDILYYNPNDYKKSEISEILKDIDLKITSIKGKNVPDIIKNSF
jgi:hypothetical protein